MLEIFGGGAAKGYTTTVVGDRNTATTFVGGVGEGEKGTEQPMAVN